MSGWARIDRIGPHNLRRGSWFPVIHDGEPLSVTLDVNGVPTSVERTSVRLAPSRRVAWSVVLEQEPNPWVGRVYAVCPVCVGRERLAGSEASLTCPSCGYDFPVDWRSVVKARPEAEAAIA